MKHLFALLLPLFLVTQAHGELRTSSVFSDHMVLQRNIAVPVWGWADPGARVTVVFAGQRKTVMADAAGKWLARLDPMLASDESRELSVTDNANGKTVKFADVLVGEVWVLGGQSNMAWELYRSTGGAEAIKRASYPWLRVLWLGWQQNALEPASDIRRDCRWEVCAPNCASNISGAGFFFAEELHKKVKFPIGLLNASVAATWGENWISRAAMDADPEFRYSLDAYEKALKTYPQKMEEWKTKKAEYETQADAARKAGRPAPNKDWFLEYGPMGPTHSRRPNGLYNAFISPIMPYAIRGVAWYQGEGNAEATLAEHYHKLLATLVRSWRDGWGQGDFPFLIVQLHGYQREDTSGTLSIVREAQMEVAREVKNCGLVSIIDDDEGVIHPKNKLLVGERLARLAEAMVYGEQIEATGPLFEGMQIHGNAMTLRFSHVGGGLQIHGATMKGFTAAGPDHQFFPAQAGIVTRDTVRVTCPEVQQPVAARYGWEACPVGNLFNDVGLPASPFRTDVFKEHDTNVSLHR